MLNVIVVYFMISYSPVAISKAHLIPFEDEEHGRNHDQWLPKLVRTVFISSLPGGSGDVRRQTINHPPVSRFGRVFLPSKVMNKRGNPQIGKEPVNHFSQTSIPRRFYFERVNSNGEHGMPKEQFWIYKNRDFKKTKETSRKVQRRNENEESTQDNN